MVTWRPVLRIRTAAMKARESRLNPTAAACFIQRIMSDRTLVRLVRVAEGIPDGPWTDAQAELLGTLVDAVGGDRS
jgi:hypothetical protein